MTKATKAVKFANGDTYPYENLWDDALARGDAVLLKGKEAQIALTDYRRSNLLELIQPNDVLTAVCTHYNSRSGAAKYKLFAAKPISPSRAIVRNITRRAAELCGFRLSKDDEIIMGGWGYNKAFQIGYDLGRSLWPNGTPEPHGTRNGEPDSDGGYALTVNCY